MTFALLRVRSSPSQVIFSFGDDPTTYAAPMPEEALVDGAMQAAAEHWGTNPLSSIVTDAAFDILPSELEVPLSRWATVESGDRTLFVVCDDALLRRLPWEVMLRLRFGQVLDLFVARVAVAKKDESPPQIVEGKSPVLMAGWARLEGSTLPGIERELREVAKCLKSEFVDLCTLGSPTPNQLQRACAEYKPQIVHLSSPAISNWWTTAKLAMAADVGVKEGEPSKSSAIDMVPAKKVSTILKSSPNVALVVLNTCNSGLGLSHEIASNRNAVCVGWSGFVQDNIAADFAVYFYQRLLEGYSVIGAASSFAKLGRDEANGDAELAPTVWLPSPAWADWAPFSRPPAVSRQKESSMTPLVPAFNPVSDVDPVPDFDPVPDVNPAPDFDPVLVSSAGRRKAKRKSLSKSSAGRRKAPRESLLFDDLLAGRQTSAQSMELLLRPETPISTIQSTAPTVEIEFRLRDAINPALLLNGNSPIQYLTFNSDHEISRVRLEIECDAGGSASTYCRTMRLREGTNPITDLGKIVFPALFDLASRDAPRRMINFTVRLSRNFGLVSEVLVEKTLGVQWMARNEWLDRGELWAFIPAFVQPNSRGVRQVLDDAVRMLRFIGEPQSDFDGYAADMSEQGNDVMNQVRAIFQTLREDPYCLTYISPLAGPVYEGGGSSPAGQFVRFPDEVIQHKRGTCHDLTLLFASCLEHVGIRPMIVLVRGHTFLGFWRQAQDHNTYWREAKSATGRGEPTAQAGVIPRVTSLKKCLAGGQENSPLVFLECTKVTERTATYDEAVDDAWKRVSSLTSKEFQAAVDVFVARAQVQPL